MCENDKFSSFLRLRFGDVTQEDKKSLFLVKSVTVIAPGLLQGYLSKAELSNSLLLIPPPPEEGSIAFSFDQEYANKAVESKDAARFVRATHDAIPYFPEAVESFESTLGIEIRETKTPKLYVLLRRVLTDAALSTMFIGTAIWKWDS